MKRFLFFYALLPFIELHAAEKISADKKFEHSLRQFVTDKQHALLDHIKKARKSLRHCRQLIKQEQLASQDNGFYYLQTTIDEKHKTSATVICLSPLFGQKYRELLGFDDTIATDTRSNEDKMFSDFFRDFPHEDVANTEHAILMSTAKQFRASYRGFIKLKKSEKLHEGKVEKIKLATEAALEYLKNGRGYSENAFKRKHLSDRPRRVNREVVPLRESPSF